MTDPTIKQAEKFLKENGKRAAMTLSLLGKVQPFVHAMNSELGREILQDDILRHEDLLVKLYEENITDQEKAEFRYLKSRIKSIAEKINAYEQRVKEIAGK